ncbi:S8 family serine peptidase [Synoicihabitans lomoniglobus]|uniref:S8 family serine peptidase n=1 Tax=Synoicihabitans lomoniglobus TaxID=2909285 RepID=A0AAE9ZQ81_9BACT|nr:S8 family serine peptidase [Opitutaceae bacterium LMO-M01]WED63015.1 S8 family serine peptidase [Opitutaceae bacterium LMO-M01]
MPVARAPSRRIAVLVLITAAVASIGLAAPDSERMRTKTFSATELTQGYSNQKVVAMPRLTAGTEYNEAFEADLAAAEIAEGFEIDRVFTRLGGMRSLLLPDHLSPAAAQAQLMATGRYEFVDFDRIRRAAVLPNDPLVNDGRQWHHRNTGQSGGTVGADIGSEAAWNLRTDASNIIVAVIDTGARLTHQDLVANLWTNPGEIAGNNRDDDNNGYIDDVHGIDSRVGTGSPNDPEEDGHGTHVAGIIGAVGNNGIAGSGVAWRVQLMPLRFLGGEDGNGSGVDEIECIDYAIAKGADIINASFGQTGYYRAESEAIRRARNAGIIFVTSAGNDGLDLDLSSVYPASYAHDNIVTVGNSTRLDDEATSSNTGSGMVDLFAPGSEILSLGVADDTATLVQSGTSMAAPMVSGAIALLKAHYPADTYRSTINRLLRGVTPVTAFRGRVQTGGRLNVAGALATTDRRPFNDDFADRAVLAGEVVSVRNSLERATSEAGEPSHAGRLGRSLWFTWTAPAAGLVSIDTRGSLGDTQLSVYTGTTLSGLNLVVDNDNESAGFLTSRVNFTAASGTSYHIAVDGTSAGLLLMNLSSSAANDDFNSAQSLEGDAPLVTTTNANATAQSGEPLHATGANRKSLWYKWTAPHDGNFQVSAYSSSANPALAVYRGSRVNNLTVVGRNDDSGIDGANLNALVSFAAVEDTTYHIALDTLGEEVGEITVSVTDAIWQFTTGQNTSDPDELYLRRPTVTNVPAIGPDGTIYVGSQDAFFYALNPDGTLKWRVATDGYADSNAAAVAPDGTIHFGTYTGIAYALNPDGSERWTSNLGESSYFSAPAVAADGTVYFKQDSGTLRAFSPAGVEQWSYSVPDGEASYAGPAIAADGAILLPANDGALHAINPSGSRRWRFSPTIEDGTPDDSGIYTSPSIDANGNIYASTLNGTVFSLTANGNLRWVFRTPDAGENVSSSIALGDGRAYFASYGAFLYALDQADGTLVWKANIEAQARASSPAIASDGSVIVGSYANKLFRFDRDGELIRSWSAGNWFRSSPALADGRLYIGNGDGKVYAFDLDGIGPAAGADYPWPQYRHGPRHLGRATLESIGQIITPMPDDPGRFVNLSVRNRTTRGNGVLTAGFVLQGDVTKELVVRGVGPALSDFGVAGVVTETALEVFRSDDISAALATNRGWNSNSGDGRDLGAFELPDASDDSVVRVRFDAAVYTAQVSPRNAATEPGVALVEIYDGAVDELRTRLTNLSARTNLTANGDVTIGFVLKGATPRTLLLRAVGPGLDEFLNPATTLNDPRLTLLAGQTAEVGNDDWRGFERVRAAAETVGAFPLQNDSADAAFVISVPPGAYTARVTAPSGQSGIVLVEVYLLPE